MAITKFGKIGKLYFSLNLSTVEYISPTEIKYKHDAHHYTVDDSECNNIVNFMLPPIDNITKWGYNKIVVRNSQRTWER